MESSYDPAVEDNDIRLSRLLEKSRKSRLTIERTHSFDERSWSELSMPGRGFDAWNGSLYSPGVLSGFGTPGSYSTRASFAPNPIVVDAWEALRRSLVFFRGQPVGTIAAYDHASEEVLNYDQVFVRDFVPSGLAFLMNGEPETVKNFLLKTRRLQGWEKMVERFRLGEGVMPASFKFKVINNPIRP